MKLFWILLFCSVNLFAQLPNTKVYMVDVVKERGGTWNCSNLKLISNKKGYNNQPYFTPDGNSILFASNNGKGNTDIYKYALNKSKITRLTKTAEAEYSPKYNTLEEEITCVRVEKDTVTQHFYGYNLKGKKGHLFLPDLTAIGYYTWFTSTDIIALVLPEPFYLVKYNINNLKADTLANNPGRCLQTNKGGVYYVDKTDTTNFIIKRIAKENLSNKKPKQKVENPIIINALTNSEDFCMLYDGTFIMGSGSKVYIYRSDRKGTKPMWKEVADLKELGIKNFVRPAISQDGSKLAFVVIE